MTDLHKIWYVGSLYGCEYACKDPESFIFGQMAKNVLEASTNIRQASFMLSIGQHIISLMFPKKHFKNIFKIFLIRFKNATMLHKRHSKNILKTLLVKIYIK